MRRRDALGKTPRADNFRMRRCMPLANLVVLSCEESFEVSKFLVSVLLH